MMNDAQLCICVTPEYDPPLAKCSPWGWLDVRLIQNINSI